MSEHANLALAVIPRNLGELQQVSRHIHRSSLLPADLRGKEPEVFMTMAAGAELGLPPMAALRSICIVKGRPVIAAKAQMAICLRSGVALWFRRTEFSGDAVTWQTLRRGHEAPESYRFTMSDARDAGLVRPNDSSCMYRKYGPRMLSSRALGYLCGDVYPDVLAGAGLMTPDEADEVDEVYGDEATRGASESDGVVTGEIVDDSPTPALSAAPEPDVAAERDAAPPETALEWGLRDALTQLPDRAAAIRALKAAAAKIGQANPTGDVRSRLTAIYQDVRKQIEAAAEAA